LFLLRSVESSGPSVHAGPLELPPRSKNIDILYHWLCKIYNTGLIQINYISTHRMKVDQGGIEPHVYPASSQSPCCGRAECFSDNHQQPNLSLFYFFSLFIIVFLSQFHHLNPSHKPQTPLTTGMPCVFHSSIHYHSSLISSLSGVLAFIQSSRLLVYSQLPLLSKRSFLQSSRLLVYSQLPLLSKNLLAHYINACDNVVEYI
ncbi:uncharacterized protein VP01_8455g1, partial [Puccinia sorghi]